VTPLDGLEQALTSSRRGLRVIPIPQPRSGIADGKRPTLPWKPWQTRAQSEADIRRINWRGQNVGILTGAPSGVVVVDVDDIEALPLVTRRLTYTPWQVVTGRGGYHLYYQAPEGGVRNRTRIALADRRLAVDVRGDGGFVIAAGSLHANGARYREAGDWSVPREQLPRFWPGWIRRVERPAAPRPSVAVRSTPMTERARKYLAAIPQPQIGQGSDEATFSAACRLLRGFDLAPADVTELLWAWAGGRPGWTYDWVAEKVTNAARFGSEAVGALR
jgi:hypothetical protein